MMEIPMSISTFFLSIFTGIFTQLNESLFGICNPQAPGKVLTVEASTLIIPNTTKIESNNCFIIHCLKENNENALSHWTPRNSTLEIMQRARNLQIIH